MNWNFHLPVELVFGSGTRHEIKSYIKKIGGTRGVLVCGKSFLRNGTADAFLQAADGALVSVFSDIRPNPTTENVNACAAEMRRVEADFAVALGGGSSIDTAKAVGIIVNNGIVLVDYINQQRLSGMERREAIIDAGVTRLRPILMTSLTTILGLIVTATAKNAGTALMQPIAVVCIGGLLYATLMTLFVVPCMYDMMNKKDMQKVDESELQIVDM